MEAALHTKTIKQTTHISNHHSRHQPAEHLIQLPAWQRAVVLVLGAAVFLAIAAQLLLGSWYAGRIFPGVTVSGSSLGGLTRQDAKLHLQWRVSDYRVSLMAGNKPYSFTPEQLGVYYDVESTVNQAFLQGRDSWYAPWGIWKSMHSDRSSRLAMAYQVDRSLQQALVQKVVTETGHAPIDATIAINGGVPTVQPDSQGLALAPAQVTDAILHQINTLDENPVTLTPVMQAARIRAANVAPAIDQAKQILAVPISITYNGQTFQPTAAQMGGWVTFEKTAPDQTPGLIPLVHPDNIKQYLQSLALKIDASPVNRQVTINNGVTTETRAGVDGIRLDQDTLASRIADALTARAALSTEAPTVSVSFQTETNRVLSLDYGRYIEVNLDTQQLTVYQDHQVIYESPITSGATGAGFPTVQGLFSIQAKETNRNLNGYAIGYNYNVFVKYWMPFDADYGLHDASWRSSFGGSDYYYGGSHGCVNMPDAAAAFLYDWASVGTPVWVHA